MRFEGLSLVSGTGNPHKLREIKEILEPFGIRILSKEEAGVGGFDVEETGETFEENSLLKAESIMKETGLSAIADDSGLEVEALDGAPGVYSARFAAGEFVDDEKNNIKLLGLMEEVPDEERRARFVSVITICFNDGTVVTARGECPGQILRAPVGDGGFGYDPLFLPDGCDETFAQISEEKKNQISHRAAALNLLKEKLLVLENESAGK